MRPNAGQVTTNATKGLDRHFAATPDRKTHHQHGPAAEPHNTSCLGNVTVADKDAASCLGNVTVADTDAAKLFGYFRFPVSLMVSLFGSLGWRGNLLSCVRVCTNPYVSYQEGFVLERGEGDLVSESLDALQDRLVFCTLGG